MTCFDRNILFHTSLVSWNVVERNGIMDKILTVSIAAYNVERYIESALVPFMNADIIDMLEIFVIDDGGSDSTLALAEKYRERYPQSIKLVHKENGGWGSTVNYGIEHATGKYFKQLDGDDYFSAEVLPHFVSYLKNVDCDLVYTPYTVFEDLTNRVIDVKDISDDFQKMKVYDILDINKLINLNMHSCTFKTSLLKTNVNILEHCFYTDVEYMIKALAKVKTAVFCDLNIYQYRVARSGQSMSVEGLRKHYKEHEKVTIRLLNFYYKTEVPANLRQIIKGRIKEMVESQYMLFLYLNPNKNHKTELINFNRTIRDKFSEFYNINVSRINFLRRIGFLGYSLVAKNTQRKIME